MDFPVTAAAGTYSLVLHYAHCVADSSFHVELNGVNVGFAVALPQNNTYPNLTTFSDLMLPPLNLTAGYNSIRLVSVDHVSNGPWNLFQTWTFTRTA